MANRSKDHKQGRGSCSCFNLDSNWGPVDPRDIKAFREGRACVGGYVSKAAYTEEMRIREKTGMAVS